MATRKRTKKSLTQILILLAAVAVVVTVSVAFQSWWNNRPVDLKTVHLSATTPDTTVDVSPYALCELGEDCIIEDSATIIPVGENETLSITVPNDVWDHDWTMLTIYDNPAANDEKLFGGKQQKNVNVPGSVDPLGEGQPRPKLLVVEIRSAMTGTNAQGQEAPYGVTWAIHTGENVVDNAAVATSTPVTQPAGS